MMRTSLLIEISVMGFFFVAISTELNVLNCFIISTVNLAQINAKMIRICYTTFVVH